MTWRKTMYEHYLLKLHFKQFTPIQLASFDAFLKPQSIVGIAPTGTGKTLAYGIPVVESLDVKVPHVQVIMMLPTNELVVQVKSMLEILSDEVKVMALLGTKDKAPLEKQLMKSPPHILIGTPRQLYEMVVERAAVNTKFVKEVILDEADMMFEEDFMNSIETLMTRFKLARYALYSASLSQTMMPFIKHFFGAYQTLDTSSKHTLSIVYPVIQVQDHQRLDAIKRLTRVLNPYVGLIFTSSKDEHKLVYDALIEEGLKVASLSSKDGLKKRLQTLKGIQNLEYTWIVATDVAARGIDFDVSHVIHYSIPKPLSFFKHRSGRTGRMHQTGVVITIISEQDQHEVNRLKKQGITFIKGSIKETGLYFDLKTTDKEIKEVTQKKKVRVTPNYKKKYQALKKKRGF
jgi:ATP-dependent RNA helicase CshB